VFNGIALPNRSEHYSQFTIDPTIPVINSRAGAPSGARLAPPLGGREWEVS